MEYLRVIVILDRLVNLRAECVVGPNPTSRVVTLRTILDMQPLGCFTNVIDTSYEAVVRAFSKSNSWWATIQHDLSFRSHFHVPIGTEIQRPRWLWRIAHRTSELLLCSSWKNNWEVRIAEREHTRIQTRRSDGVNTVIIQLRNRTSCYIRRLHGWLW